MDNQYSLVLRCFSALGSSTVIGQCSPSRLTGRHAIDKKNLYTVGGSTPLPGFITKTDGSFLWDVDGKRYIDFICMAGAVNQGHCHPKLLTAVRSQLEEAALVNHSTNNAKWPAFAQMMCQRFGYDKIASAVSGTDGVDIACKVARKWAITKKLVPTSEMLTLGVSDCFHGLSSGVWGLQNRSNRRSDYGIDDKHLINYNPATGAVLTYGNLDEMGQCLAQHHKVVAAVILECIRAHLPTFAEEIEYAQGVFDLCQRYNILFIADEVRMGVCRTGRFLGSDYLAEGCKPDMTILGKSITGGVYPASYILGKEEVMSILGKREIVQTFAFSPMAIAATTCILQIVDDDNLAERAGRLEALFTERSERFGWGALPFVDYESRESCQAVGFQCMLSGLLMFQKENHLRISVPLIITENIFAQALDILGEALENHASSLTAVGNLNSEFTSNKRPLRSVL
ncbi:putative acetylornithine aminotransferase [Cadophora sp. DSE1049]|nr:putative acetylornithine aminotransferase [Cadophora sp. DSE1049]